MKTLVIHPEDDTTKFLRLIYEGKDWMVINHTVSSKYLKEQIKEHDRIIMLGHGTREGLMDASLNRFVIDSTFVYLLKEKECVCIWCNADGFAAKYDIRGFYTGMIISDDLEANMYCIDATHKQIEDSNKVFAEAIATSIDEPRMLTESQYHYDDVNNPVIVFNRRNMYYLSL